MSFSFALRQLGFALAFKSTRSTSNVASTVLLATLLAVRSITFFNLTATCLTLGYMGLFVLFLGTLLPEIFAFLLGINAGLNLNERRASGVKPWLRAEDVWLLLGLLLFLIPAGIYEAFFIANILSP